MHLNSRKHIWFCLPLAGVLGLASPPANAQLPTDFPQFVVASNGPVAPGDLIGTLGWKGTATNVFEAVLDTGGSPLYTNPTQVLWRAVAPNGLIAEKGNTSWVLRDETFSEVGSYAVGNGYSLDGHDFKLLPNGDALVLETENWPVDMSQFFPGGRPDAVLSSVVFQEIAPNNQVLFEWHARFHLPITDSLDYNTLSSVDWTHANSLTIDPLDNNYLLSLRGFCQILKISRTNGAVLWRLGGISNQFTFIGENPANAPYYFIGEHNIHRLANGDILFFDNGSLQGQGSLPGRTYSRAIEYRLDETNLTATLVWQYRHVPDVFTTSEGIVKRFTNGNTYVGWVAAAQQGTGPTLTEVNSSNQVMFELSLPGYQAQSILNKQEWNTPNLVQSITNYGIVAGQVYDAINAGVSVTVNTLSGPTNNELIVSTHYDAVRFPEFTGKAPQVLVQRATLSGTNLGGFSAGLSFTLPANNYCFDTPIYPDPSQLTVYQRTNLGQGLFLPLPTVYNPVAQTLTVSITQLGEFIFAYPDLPEVPLAPILFGSATQPSVNEAEPVMFQWTPNGFVRSFHLQVAIDSGFTNLVVDQPALTNFSYTLASVLPGTNYYWRVNVADTGGTSDWSTASFATVPPMVEVTSPAGGEAWQRGLPYFIKWTNNLAENVAIKLYKGGTLVSTLAANAPNLGAYYWPIDFSNAPADNYSIRISSATNTTWFGTSPLPFSIVDPPAIVPGSVVVLPNGSVQLGLAAPGAATATILISTNLTTWKVLQSVPVINGSAVITDNTATNFTDRFYRLSLP